MSHVLTKPLTLMTKRRLAVYVHDRGFPLKRILTEWISHRAEICHYLSKTFFMYFFTVITAHKRSLRRLCFHMCLSVHGGCLCPEGGVPVKEGLYPEGLCPEGLCPNGLCPNGLCPGVSVQKSLSRGVSVRSSLSRGIYVQGHLCPGGSLSGVLCPMGLGPKGLCPGTSLSRGSLSRGCLSRGSLSRGSLSRGVSVQRGLRPEFSIQGVSVKRGLCQKGSLSEVSVQGHLCHRGFSVQGSLSARPRTVMCRWYASY